VLVRRTRQNVRLNDPSDPTLEFTLARVVPWEALRQNLTQRCDRPSRRRPCAINPRPQLLQDHQLPTEKIVDDPAKLGHGQGTAEVDHSSKWRGAEHPIPPNEITVLEQTRSMADHTLQCNVMREIRDHVDQAGRVVAASEQRQARPMRTRDSVRMRQQHRTNGLSPRGRHTVDDRHSPSDFSKPSALAVTLELTFGLTRFASRVIRDEAVVTLCPSILIHRRLLALCV
jgi:hypothetical protein